MERLTIKKLEKQLHQAIKQHVAFCAPIEISNYKQDYVGIQYSKANGYYMLAGDIYVTYDGGSTGKSVKDFRFLLKPMSDFNDSELSKEWAKEHDIKFGVMGLTLNLRDAKQIDLTHFPLQLLFELFKHHFDVFGLIDLGLALPIDGKEVEGEL